MNEDSLVRTLFLDGGNELLPAAKSGKSAIPDLSPLLFVNLSVGLDFCLLFAITFACAPHLFLSGIFKHDPTVTAFCVAALAMIPCSIAKLHRIEVVANYRRFLRRFQKTWTIIAIVMIVLYPLIGSSPAAPRAQVLQNWLWIGAWLAAFWACFTAARYALARLYLSAAAAGIICHRVVIVGATDLAGEFIRRARQDGMGVRVGAIFDDQDDTWSRSIAGVPVRGNIDDLLFYHKHHDIDTVVITLPLQNNAQMRRLVQRLSMQPLRVTMLPGELALEMSPDWCAPAGSVPGIHLLQITDLPIERSGRLIKGLFDRFVAGLAILFFLPVLALCAAGIKLTSPGPVFFKQKRIGYRNRHFEVYKFRTMHVAACNTGKLTTRNDPRVFAFGQLLRRLSFDELPQLLNVLRGDMSLVGPRPHMPEARAAGQLYFDVVTEYAARHRVKPGITGWAQVNGWRGPTETVGQIEKRVMHDLYYIDNWSLGLDLKILFLTVFVGFFGKNAF